MSYKRSHYYPKGEENAPSHCSWVQLQRLQKCKIMLSRSRLSNFFTGNGSKNEVAFEDVGIIETLVPFVIGVFVVIHVGGNTVQRVRVLFRLGLLMYLAKDVEIDRR